MVDRKRGELPVPPIEDRVVKIGNDRLVPLELTLGEFTFLLKAVEDVVVQEGFIIDPIHRKLDEIGHDGLIEVAFVFEGEDTLFSDDPINIFDLEDPVYISLSRPRLPETSRTRHELKALRRDLGREPTSFEKDEVTKAQGYQLQVLGWDEDKKQQLRSALEAYGFPISDYRGLEEIATGQDIGEVQDDRWRGDAYENLVANCMAAILEHRDQLLSDRKISRTTWLNLGLNNDFLKENAEQIVGQAIEDEIREIHPSASDEELKLLKLEFDFRLLLGRFGE